jgi:hypothetical protein
MSRTTFESRELSTPPEKATRPYPIFRDPSPLDRVATKISGIHRGRHLHAHAIFQAFGVRYTQLPLGMIGNRRTSAVTEIKPMARLAGFNFQFAEGLKNGGILPNINKRFLREFSCVKFLFL